MKKIINEKLAIFIVVAFGFIMAMAGWDNFMSGKKSDATINFGLAIIMAGAALEGKRLTKKATWSYLWDGDEGERRKGFFLGDLLSYIGVFVFFIGIVDKYF